MMSDHGGISSIPPQIRGFGQEVNTNPNPNLNQAKRKRNLPGNPDPDAEVIALSPKSLMATNRFLCEICNKGFQRDQNLQLHRRGHNLPWKLKQRTNKEVRKKVYICPEKSCVHHDPCRALGDLTGVKKHFSRKHGEKKWKCEKCSKKYAVQSDWKAHSKICGTREYKCDCGTIFSRKDSFITHRAFCDALAEESTRFSTLSAPNLNFQSAHELLGGPRNNFSMPLRPEFSSLEHSQLSMENDPKPSRFPLWLDSSNLNPSVNNNFLAPVSMGQNHDQLAQANMFGISSRNHQWLNIPSSSEGLKEEEESDQLATNSSSSLFYNNQNLEESSITNMPATSLLQKAAQMGSSTSNNSLLFNPSFGLMSSLNFTNSFNQRNNSVQASDNINSGAGFLSGDFSSPMGNGTQKIDNYQHGMNMVPNDRSNLSKLSVCESDGSLTRDFLGVGSRGRPIFPQGDMAKFDLDAATGLNELFNPGH